MPSDLPDERLVIAAQEGDREAWAELCRRHVPRLAAYLGGRLRRPAVVDRMVAEVAAGAWKHLAALERPGDFPAWFRRVGGNLTLQWCRKHPDEALAGPFPAERCGGDEELRKRMERLESGLGMITDVQRMALEQHLRGGMDVASLSESLHLSHDGVRQLLDEALAALEAQLGPET